MLRVAVAVLLSALALGAPNANAQATWPQRPVKIVVPLGPGSGGDITARLLSDKLAQKWGQSVVVENRPGGDGVVALSSFIGANDDHTLLISPTSTFTHHPWMHDKMPYDAKELVPIARITNPLVAVVVPGSSPWSSLKELFADVRANPGKLNMGSSGNGSVSHVFGELFKMETGIELVHVPNRGGYIADLLGGQTQVVFGTIAASITLISAGKLRALAVTTAARSAALPQVPAIGESVPGYDGSQWYGICAPKDTPPAIVNKLNSEINAALGDANLKARFADLGVDPTPTTPAGFGKFMATETEKWAKVIRTAKLKPE